MLYRNQADAATQTAEKAAFASYNDRAEQLDALGITKEIFWEGVKAHFKVKSRAEMTAEQYVATSQRLERKRLLHNGYVTSLRKRPRRKPPKPKRRQTLNFEKNFGILGFIYPWLHNQEEVWAQTGQDPFDVLHDVD